MLFRGKIGPENRVNIFLSYKSGIKKPDNSIGLYVINYDFNFFIRIIVIAHLKKMQFLALRRHIFMQGGGVTKNKISRVWIMLESQMRHQINCEACGQFSSQKDPWI